MSSPAGPRPGLAPLSRDAPSLRAARKDPSVPSRRCHRAACEDGHTFQPPVPPPGSKSRKAARRSRLPSAQRGGVRGPLSLCPWPGWPGSPSSLCLEHPFGLGLHCFLPLAPCLSGSALRVRGGSGWLWEPLRGAGGGGPLGPGSQGGLRLLQFLCTLRLAGEMWFRAAGWAHRPSCGLDSEACHCHHMRPEVA